MTNNTAPRCEVCHDTGSKSRDLFGDLDCTACDVATERASFEKWLSKQDISSIVLYKRDAWLIYQHGKQVAADDILKRQAPVAWGILSEISQEVTNDPDLAGYWQRKGRDVIALYAQPSEPVARPWKALTDVQWMNIVNHDRAYDDWSKEEAVHHAVKLTEAKCREVNNGTVPIAVPANDLIAAAERMRKAHTAAKIPGKIPAFAEAYEYQAAVQELIAAATKE